MAFWQEFEAPIGMEAPRRADALVPMPDGSALRLPLRDYGAVGVTGLIANQASFAVARRLAGWMADAASRFAPEVVVGLPTLGHVFGPLVAEALGHSNWVAPGYSRKLWYEEGLSVPLASSTTPVSRRLWLDPRLVARIEGRRVLLVDDVISTGHSALAGLELLAKAGVRPAAACVAMAQGDRWRAAWPGEVPLVAAFATPLYRPTPEGWVPMPETAPRDVAL
ncbi:phosphoribosyltransferase [Belnapia rosea]|uniref:Adenine/guanine phosphoribosyltransferase n=1 Tax=Belnapia rosea TaxID=938405 RepID=A0A1G6R2X6_9PROT|nr:phosphoribosyltransferase [Belnapia rosea]SDC98990.1 Adenine/guanine phosphoribosyltransferase [Belnapia rosea]